MLNECKTVIDHGKLFIDSNYFFNIVNIVIVNLTEYLI
jgi:hypothetical protein